MILQTTDWQRVGACSHIKHLPLSHHQCSHSRTSLLNKSTQNSLVSMFMIEDIHPLPLTTLKYAAVDVSESRIILSSRSRHRAPSTEERSYAGLVKGKPRTLSFFTSCCEGLAGRGMLKVEEILGLLCHLRSSKGNSRILRRISYEERPGRTALMCHFGRCADRA